MVNCEKNNEDNVVIIDASFAHHSEFIASPVDKSEGAILSFGHR